MALVQITYYNGETILSCTTGEPIQSGEAVKFTLDGTNPAWPEFFTGLVVNVLDSTAGPTYVLAYDSDDFPFECPSVCNFYVECATCCDLLTPARLISILQSTDQFQNLIAQYVDQILNP